MFETPLQFRFFFFSDCSNGGKRSNRLRECKTIFIHSNQSVPIGADAFQYHLSFTHCTIHRHITMQLAAANRYIYQHPRAARDKYALVFRERCPRFSFSLRRLAKLSSPVCDGSPRPRAGEKRRREKESKTSGALEL